MENYGFCSRPSCDFKASKKGGPRPFAAALAQELRADSSSKMMSLLLVGGWFTKLKKINNWRGKQNQKQSEFSGTTKRFSYALCSELGFYPLFSLVGFHVAEKKSCFLVPISLFFTSSSFHRWTNKQILPLAGHEITGLGIGPCRLRSVITWYLHSSFLTSGGSPSKSFHTVLFGR